MRIVDTGCKAYRMISGQTKADMLRNEECQFCSNHYKGDTLYENASWDNGVGFELIRDIEYCPLCGKLLEE